MQIFHLASHLWWKIALTRSNSNGNLMYYFHVLCSNKPSHSHFDYGYSSCLPFLKKNLKLKLRIVQNKYIRFCLNLPLRCYIDRSHFRKINWLPVSNRVEYCITNTVLKYWSRIVPGYIDEMFNPSLCRYSTRSQMVLDIPLRKTNKERKSLSHGQK